ncbi:hypothetical protein CANCADRAFT_82656 [Tortispora caseinolytica NRRL Y-17796]|uniref:Uncharacterized protein n=1 Tax=Tortispora caseinolytica NRRL Y-17796 TaxID=767744 RepID=A0A1E4TK44_9ASCO|nr:hypothetical protein CANCADRAFT_82656 [Tortispora caseinolytica NRRL Y-17796]
MLFTPYLAVSILLEDLACDGHSGIDLEELWIRAATVIPGFDPRFKPVIWKWLLSRTKDIRIQLSKVKPSEISNNEFSIDNYALIEQIYKDHIKIAASDEVIWKFLTGKPENENSEITPLLFDILSIVAKCRGAGATVTDIASQTGQDPRSLFSRVSRLVRMGLVIKRPFVQNGVNTNIVTLSKFVKNYNADSDQLTTHTPYTDLSTLCRRIMDSLKSAKNNIRQADDLRHELNCSETSEKRKQFLRAIARLSAHGYLRRVKVQSLADSEKSISDSSILPENAKNQNLIKCIQLLRGNDLPKLEGSLLSDRTSTENDDNEQQLAAYKNTSNTNVTVARSFFSRFYPLELQVYNLVLSSNRSGMTSIDLNDHFAIENSFQRPLSGILERYSLSFNPKKGKSLKGYDFVKVSDTSGKLVVFRCFIAVFAESVGVRLSDSHSLPHYDLYHQATQKGVKKDTKNLDASFKIHMHPIVVSSINGEIHIDWKPSTSLTSSTGAVMKPARPRGRPRKFPKEQAVETELNTLVKRARGRPRKYPIQQANMVEISPTPEIQEEDLGPPSEMEFDQIEQSDNVDDVQESLVTQQQPVDEQEQPVIVFASDTDDDSKPLPKKAKIKRHSEKTYVNVAAEMRQKNIMTLLDESHNVMLLGQNIASRFQERFLSPNDPRIDKRTLMRDIYALENKGLVKKSCVMHSTTTGKNVAKWFLVNASLDINSDYVKGIQEKLLEQEKAKSNITKPLDIIQEDVSYYSIPPISSTYNSHLDNKVDKVIDTINELSEEGSMKASAEISFRARRNIDVKPDIVVLPSSRRQKLARAASGSAQYRAPLGRTRGETDGLKSKSASPKPDTEGSVSPALKQKHARFTRQDADTLLRVVVIIRSFFSPGGGMIDWSLIASIFNHTYSIDFLRTRWAKVRDFYGGSKMIASFNERWEELYIDGYKKGVLGKFDPDNFDVFFYVEYWRNNESKASKIIGVDRLGTHDNIDSLLSQHYIHTDPSVISIETEWNGDIMQESSHVRLLSDILQDASSDVKKMHVLTETCFSYSKESTNSGTGYTDVNSEKALRLIRAIINTPEETYDAAAAEVALSRLGENTVRSSLNMLERIKALVHIQGTADKQIPGRNYVFSERALSLLNSRYHLSLEELHQADMVYMDLEEKCKDGVKLPRIHENASMLALVSLISNHDNVRLERDNIVKGSLVEGYLSRAVDKDKLEFDLTLRGTVPLNSKSVQPSRLSIKKPPIDAINGEVMSWLDVTCKNVNEEFWTKIVCYVLWTIETSPFINLTSLTYKCRYFLTLQEVNYILDFLHDIGCIERGSSNGTILTTDWYRHCFVRGK